ncbi:uncharacterized protein [Macaca nemestrina]|uniref:uncharacterized protein n=1 Tax=Macaca nemestrina TaxID=9545 RepID=UPI0039B84C93
MPLAQQRGTPLLHDVQTAGAGAKKKLKCLPAEYPLGTLVLVQSPQRIRSHTDLKREYGVLLSGVDGSQWDGWKAGRGIEWEDDCPLEFGCPVADSSPIVPSRTSLSIQMLLLFSPWLHHSAACLLIAFWSLKFKRRSAASLQKSARPRPHQKEETADTSEHLKEQTRDTPSLRTVTFTGRVHCFILEVSKTKNPPIPDTIL